MSHAILNLNANITLKRRDLKLNMEENIIARTLRAIESSDYSKEASHQRLLAAEIITKSGRLSKWYRTPADSKKR